MLFTYSTFVSYVTVCEEYQLCSTPDSLIKPWTGLSWSVPTHLPPITHLLQTRHCQQNRGGVPATCHELLMIKIVPFQSHAHSSTSVSISQTLRQMFRAVREVMIINATFVQLLVTQWVLLVQQDCVLWWISLHYFGLHVVDWGKALKQNLFGAFWTVEIVDDCQKSTCLR